jgi:hypothetical protein
LWVRRVVVGEGGCLVGVGRALWVRLGVVDETWDVRG